MKIRSVFLELLHLDRRTERHGEDSRLIFATISCERVQNIDS
jgi:hypothetical protein